MSSQSEHEENQDETSSQGYFQQRNEDWDDIFRGKGHSFNNLEQKLEDKIVNIELLKIKYIGEPWRVQSLNCRN